MKNVHIRQRIKNWIKFDKLDRQRNDKLRKTTNGKLVKILQIR